MQCPMWVPEQMGAIGQCPVWRLIASGLATATLYHGGGAGYAWLSPCRQLFGGIHLCKLERQGGASRRLQSRASVIPGLGHWLPEHKKINK